MFSYIIFHCRNLKGFVLRCFEILKNTGNGMLMMSKRKYSKAESSYRCQS